MTFSIFAEMTVTTAKHTRAKCDPRNPFTALHTNGGPDLRINTRQGCWPLHHNRLSLVKLVLPQSGRVNILQHFLILALEQCMS